MKALIVAVFAPHSSNVSQADAFERLGVSVIRFDYRSAAKRLGGDGRDKLILEMCRDEKPDFVFFSKCNEVKLSVVRGCNRICPTILWYMDAMNSNFCISLMRKIRHCTLSFFAAPVPYARARKISRSGGVYFLQQGFDPLLHRPVECREKYDVSFIGTIRKERRRYIQAWPIHVIEGVYGLELSKAICESKINLNFTYKNHGTSERTYKILASKGFLLTTPWLNMEDDFKAGVDLDTFQSPEELRDKIEFYLSHDEIRNKIAESGYKTVQKFSRDHWARAIIRKVTEYIESKSSSGHS